MPLIFPASGSKVAAAYSISNSCRFNDDDSPKLALTPGSTSDAIRQKWTFSCWFKIGNLGAQTGARTILFPRADSSNYSYFDIQSDDTLRISDYRSGYQINLITNRLFRDTAAWYHLVVATDTTQGTDSNRVKIYINGVQETSFATETYPDEDDVTMYNSDAIHTIGVDDGPYYFDGYFAEMVMVTNSQLAPTSFGEFDSDSPTIWKPIDVSGLTFGTNGFWLDFEASDNLGNDANGGTDWTETNLAAADQATDTPTNNFCTMNSLDNYIYASTFSEGNCRSVSGASAYCWHTSTIALTAGKWYWEVKHTVAQGTANSFTGIATFPPNAKLDKLGITNSSDYSLLGNDGKTHNGSATGVTYGTEESFADNAIVGVALDLDNNKIYYSLNGEWGTGSGDWDSTTFDAAVGDFSITAAASSNSGHYFPAFGDYASGAAAIFECNFGGCPAFAISSGNADDNGYGNFEFDVPTGFLAICTKNLGSDGG